MELSSKMEERITILQSNLTEQIDSVTGWLIFCLSHDEPFPGRMQSESRAGSSTKEQIDQLMTRYTCWQTMESINLQGR